MVISISKKLLITKSTFFWVSILNLINLLSPNLIIMTNFYRSLALMGSIILALITPFNGFYSQCVAPTPTANNATITCGQTATLTASGGTNYSWYSNAAGTQLVGTGSTFTTPMLGSNTTYYVQNSTGNNTNIFYITSLANECLFFRNQYLHR